MAYSLSTSFFGESLLSGFNWFNGADLSNGYVSYQSRYDAEARGLVSMDPSTHAVRLGVDSTNYYGMGEGRPSIRIESKESYNHGLFIADFAHMPPSDCGLWPAFWAYGKNWPNGGEIDIIEGVNTAHKNLISAHTAEGCSQDPWEVSQSTGLQRNTDCFVGDQNIGCGFEAPSSDVSSYGDSFNAVNGGVYAMDWDSERIRVWHFPRGRIPSDIKAKRPDPSNWGLPQAAFGGRSCDVDSYFKDMSIVLNINFCGDYGNALWNSGECGSYASTCSEYVGSNPGAFTNAYWEVNYIDVYQKNRGSPTTTTTKTAPAPTTKPGGYPYLPFPDPGIGIEPTAIPNPFNINRYAYLGCFESTSSFGTFEVESEKEDMTLETCVELCNAKDAAYAGVNGRVCSCARELDQDTRATALERHCARPCPGNAGQFCGGTSSKSIPSPSLSPSPKPSPSSKPGSNSKKAPSDGDKTDCLLTVYGAVLDTQPAVPPPMAPMPKSLMKGSYIIHTPATCTTTKAPAVPRPAKTPNSAMTPSSFTTPTPSPTPSGSPSVFTPQHKKAPTTLQLSQVSETAAPTASSSSKASDIPVSAAAPKAPSRMSVVIGVAVMIFAML
ncbi:unnamed protein product [Clonostachys byssicola]|uniref:Uncharacterized protein n=1 Tax=Clonostachys byssicola TaxID=160290 RepID=A0A9N9UNK7_9HYPO|nr:unnamed protein product [Clonostachys byssicola]